MSKEFDDIRKKIDQSNKKDEKLIKEISDIKKEVKNIAFKVDTMLEILNNFSIMLIEDDKDLEDNYEDEESWIPEQEEDWNSYNDDDDE